MAEAIHAKQEKEIEQMERWKKRPGAKLSPEPLTLDSGPGCRLELCTGKQQSTSS